MFGLDVITKVAATAKVHYSDYHFQSDHQLQFVLLTLSCFYHFHPPTGLVSKTLSSFWRFAKILEMHCLGEGWNGMPLQIIMNGHDHGSPGQYVLNIHFFIKLGQKMIQFNIQFKIKSKIFIKKTIHSK